MTRNAMTISKTRYSGLAAALLMVGTVFISGCNTTGSSSSNAQFDQPVRATAETQKDVDAIRPADVINRSRAHVTRSGEIYLMRGLANIWSRGIDALADKMRTKGFDASNFSYKYWQPIADDIIARAARDEVSYPIVIMGHSLGGNQSTKFANYLAERGVKVDYVVAFDPTVTGYVGGNIGKVVNYYLPNNSDNRILPASGFSGELRNIDVTSNPDITHTNVEKNPGFQATSIRTVLGMTETL